MPRIETDHGQKVAVTIKDAWIENVHTREAGDKVVVKLKGVDESGHDGIATLWLTDEVREKQDRSEVELALAKLEDLGLENGDIRNLVDIFDKPATFYVSVKDGKTSYYLDSNPSERLDVNTAYEMIEAIRGKAAKQSSVMRGEPVVGDEAMTF